MKEPKFTREHEKLEKELYDITSSIVGNVGQEIKATISNGSIKLSHEPIALFCLKRTFPADESEIMEIWKKWIEAYCFFKRYDKPEMAIYANDPGLVVRWFGKPKIETRYWPDIEHCVVMMAHLHISRINSQSIQADENVTSGISVDKG